MALFGGSRENHSMTGVYDLIDIDEELGLPYPQECGLYHVKRPHASFYMLEILCGQVDPFPILETVTMDKGDVLLVTPAKTGTHWNYEILKMLLAGKSQYVHTSKSQEWIDIQSYHDITKLYPPGKRVLNTHLKLSALPPNFVRPDTKIIMTMRNLKDTMVSYHFHMMSLRKTPKQSEKEEWDKTFKYLLYSKIEPFATFYEAYAEMWDVVRHNPNVMIVHFESLKKNPKEEIEKIAKHIGVECSDELAEEIAHAVHIDRLRQGKRETEEMPRQLFGENMTFFRKGEVADWKNYFTVAQNEEFHRVVDEWNKERQIPFVYE